MKRSSALILVVLSLATKVSAVEYGELMREISDYQYGESRWKLSYIEDLVQWSLAYPHEREKLADHLAALLSGNATLDAKQFAARQLVIVGEARHVPALAALLASAQTTDMARYALEVIDSNRVDDALLEVLAVSSRDIRIGIINTLGARESLEAIAALAAIAGGDDADEARAAIAALGRMSDSRAVRALANLSRGDSFLVEVAHARLGQAEALAQYGRVRQALRIYRNLSQGPPSSQIACASLLGQYRLADEDDREALVDEITDEEKNQIERYVTTRTH